MSDMTNEQKQSHVEALNRELTGYEAKGEKYAGRADQVREQIKAHGGKVETKGGAKPAEAQPK